jgi:acid phosphatase
VAFAGRWLTDFLAPKLADARFREGTLVVVTYDESGGPGDPARQPIYTVAIGAGGVPGTVDATPVDHYSLLRTVEDNWHLGTLGRRDGEAVPLPLQPPAR